MQKLAASLAFLGLCAGPVYAQGGRGGGDWMTSGSDAQRSGWTRSDPKISPDKMQKGGFALDWKIKLANEPTTPVTMDRYIGYRGFRALVYAGSTAGSIVAIDTDIGRVEWQKTLPGGAAKAAGGSCGGGMTANVTRPANAGFPGSPGGGRGGGGGRGAAAKSAVGEPGEGAPIIAELAARAAAAPPGRGGGGRGPMPATDSIFSPRVSLLDALGSDGSLHLMYVASGKEPKAAIPFLPANANANGLIIIDKVAYATTSQGCGGAPNGVWALDLESQQVTSWKTASDVAGTEGVAFGGDSTLYVATTDGDLTALEPKTLKVKAAYHSGTKGFASTPVVFEYKNKVLIAAAAKDGSLHVVDAAALDVAPVAKSQPDSDLGPGALTSWQDPAGTRWILAASKGAIVAWKLTEKGLESGWVSRDIAGPLTPIVINGVVFSASTSRPAVLYALDGQTGKEFWNSGKTITSFIHNGGLSASGSQVYLGTNDGTIYAFGFPIEH